MIHCRKVRARLSAYLDAFLPLKEREEIEAHLSVCAPCRRLVREIGFVRDVVSDPPLMTPSPSLASRIDRIPWEISQDRSFSVPVARVGMAFLTAAVALVVFVARPGMSDRRGGAPRAVAPQATVTEVQRLLPEERRVVEGPQWIAVSTSVGVPLEGRRVASPLRQDRDERIWQEVRRVSACSRRSF